MCQRKPVRECHLFLLHTTSPVVLQASSETPGSALLVAPAHPTLPEPPFQACVLSPDNYKGLVWGSHLPRICHGLQRSPLPTQPLHLDVSTSSLAPHSHEPQSSFTALLEVPGLLCWKAGSGSPWGGLEIPGVQGGGSHSHTINVIKFSLRDLTPPLWKCSFSPSATRNIVTFPRIWEWKRGGM